MTWNYDIMRKGEAELGWLNSPIRVTAAQPFELETCCSTSFARLRTEFSTIGAETPT